MRLGGRGHPVVVTAQRLRGLHALSQCLHDSGDRRDRCSKFGARARCEAGAKRRSCHALHIWGRLGTGETARDPRQRSADGAISHGGLVAPNLQRRWPQ